MAGATPSDRQQIIMTYSAPPSAEDMQGVAAEMLENLPEELQEGWESIAIQVEEFPDESMESELELNDPYELLAIFRKGNQIAPGVESKVANDDDVLILYRRPILDLWCESGEDLTQTIREVMIEELGRNFDFSEEEIEEMSARHYQGML